MSTESDNKRFQEALVQYKADRERIASIKARYKYPMDIPQNNFKTIQEDIEWLCNLAKNGIDNKESAWYDHG